MTSATEQQFRAASAERDSELVITALKKGAHLLKYGRRGKPRFCPFRLTNDESTLVWFSGNEEKHLKLSQVSRVIPGQRTLIFQRYPRPEKEYQSFSLLYNDRSLDLICKDKDEAEVWFTGLKSLISHRNSQKGRAEIRSGVSSRATSPRARTRTSSPLLSTLSRNGSAQKDVLDVLRLHTPCNSPPKVTMEKTLSDVISYGRPPKGFFPSESVYGSIHSVSTGGSDGTAGCIKNINGDAFRVSLSSVVSSSSQGSGHDDGDSLGDMFIWGEGTGDGLLGGRICRIGDSGVKKDSLVPKALESAVTLDVQNIACGARHAILVTKQGEVFSWGEEAGGRLGHGVDFDVLHPKFIDSLKNITVELVACGEYHSCAVTLSGEMYIWGGSSYDSRPLGQRNLGNQWIPKKLDGPLDGIHVSSVSCGPWHTVVITSAGQLFSFGDGTFGVLGHGDCQNVAIPREVESLKGLRTVRASCGVWHTAAVVEVMVGLSSSSNCSLGKLFTWGDGDKGRLGHGDKAARLVPTCVAALDEPNFCQVACGHSLTVALTITGHVYTMGSPVHGQLGNPQAGDKLPTRVEGNLVHKFVEEIACGAFHVAVLTSKSEVYTWGKGVNGQLGHGNTDDKNNPSLVEALKDKQVKTIVCGTNFTASICLHKWVSGVDQSMCSTCRLPFNFKRKRHNCYNCGLAFCHSCSSQKSLKVSMAAVPNKPYRVCDGCFNKLRKGTEINLRPHTALSRRSMNQASNGFEKTENLDSKAQLNSSIELSREKGSKISKRSKKVGSNTRASSPPSNYFMRYGNSKSSNSVFGLSKHFLSASLPGSRMVSRASSPTSRRSSPHRFTTPVPTRSNCVSPKAIDDTEYTNTCMSLEVTKLKARIEELTHKTRLREIDLETTTIKLKEANVAVQEETKKCKAAKEVIKSLTAQLKDMAERFPTGPRNVCYFSSTPQKVTYPASDQLRSFRTSVEVDSNRSTVVICNGSSTNDNQNGNPTEGVHSEVKVKNYTKTKAELNYVDEWVEQDDPGVYITLVGLPGGAQDLKRVRFSRKQFSEKQAEQWWGANRSRVYRQYNVPIVCKPSLGTGKEG